MDTYERIMNRISNGEFKDVVRFINKNPTNINETNSLGQTYLMAACECGDTDVIKFLIEKDADLKMSDVYGNNALYYAVKGHQIQALEVLISRGSDVNWTNKYGLTPLNFAALMRDEWLDGVALLLQSKGNSIIKVNQQNIEGFTPLHYACALGHKDTVCCLLNHVGIDVNATDRNGNTPLHLAVLNQHYDVVSLMLSQDSVKLENKNHIGMTPLLVAVGRGHLGIMCKLIGKGADVNADDNEGNSCLHLALKRDMFHSEVVHLSVLDKYSYKLSLKKKDRLSSRVVASYLSDLGVSLHHSNKDNVTPLDLIDNPTLKKELKAVLPLQCTYCEANVPSKFEPCGHIRLCHECYIHIACETCPACQQHITGSEPEMLTGDVWKPSQQVDVPAFSSFRNKSQPKRRSQRDDTKKLEEQDLLKVARQLGCNWWQVGIFLEVTSTQLQIIRHDYPGNLQEQSFQMLLYWSRVCDPQKFTVDTLRAALKEAECFPALELLCECCIDPDEP